MISFRLVYLLSLLALTALSARAELAPAAAAAKPLAVGATAPAVTVTSADGTAFDLGTALAEKPTLLLFYREQVGAPSATASSVNSPSSNPNSAPSATRSSPSAPMLPPAYRPLPPKTKWPTTSSPTAP